jgi:hypothetical protein
MVFIVALREWRILAQSIEKTMAPTQSLASARADRLLDSDGHARDGVTVMLISVNADEWIVAGAGA